MIYCYCGLPGSGKTSLLSQFAVTKMKKGYPVYSNYPISFKYKGVLLSTRVLTRSMIENPNFPENSILIVDEVQLWFNSRDFKSFSLNCLKFFTGHRHLGVDMYLGVQHPSRVDTVIREIIDIYIWVKVIPFFTRFKKLVHYFHFDDINRLDLPPELFYVRFSYVFKCSLLCFDSRYLRGTFSDYDSLFDSYPVFKGHYITIFEKFKLHCSMRKEFLNSISLKKNIK
jgi:hypothetical protein